MCQARLAKVSGSSEVQVRHVDNRQCLCSEWTDDKEALSAISPLLTTDTLYMSAGTWFKSGEAAQ